PSPGSLHPPRGCSPISPRCSSIRSFYSGIAPFWGGRGRALRRIDRGGGAMLATNPFAALSIAPAVMQAYVILMLVLVAAGTLFDIVHKGSAKYFFENWRKTKAKAHGPGGGELASI